MSESLAELAGILDFVMPKLDGGLREELLRRICRDLGGLDIYLAQERSDTQTIQILSEIFEEVLGAEGIQALDSLLERFGGQRLYVSKESRSFRREIALEIVELKKSGHYTQIDLAQRYRLSSRSLQELYNLGLRLNMESKAPKLF